MMGEGEQVVMIPMAEYLTDPLAPLAVDRRLLFYDPRSRGPSDRARPGTATEDREVRDMEALRTATGIDSMAVLGWSGLGKQVAVYASRHPTRVTRIVQVSPVPPSSDTYPPEEGAPPRENRVDAAAVQAVDEQWRSGGFEGDGEEYCRQRMNLTQHASFADTSRWRAAPDLCAFANEWPHNLSEYFGELLPSFGAFDWRDSIRAVGRPRLVVHGREDGIPLSGARAWVEGDPQARLLVLSPAGHFPFLEQPEPFFEAVDAFLRGRAPPGAQSIPIG
jgi:pimeloyl-ACP methyl ester carboxylesterase